MTVRRLDARAVHSLLDAVMAAHGGVCGICGLVVAREKATIDHIIPISRGGTHVPENLQPAHPLCNAFKANRTMEEIDGVAMPIPVRKVYERVCRGCAVPFTTFRFDRYYCTSRCQVWSSGRRYVARKKLLMVTSKVPRSARG